MAETMQHSNALDRGLTIGYFPLLNRYYATQRYHYIISKYDKLPDGNMDDFSQHAAESVLRVRKLLINLWIWDRA